jgi:D-methionine transport system substrate-binding protein
MKANKSMGFYWLEFALPVWILQRPLWPEPDLCIKTQYINEEQSMTTLFSVARRRRSLLTTTLLAGAALVTVLPVAAQDAGKKQLVIGGTAGSNIDQLQYGIVPILQKKG